MSGQQLTFEGVLEYMRQNERKSDRAFRKMRREMRRSMQESAAEFDRRMAESAAEFAKTRQETDRVLKRTTEEVGKLGNRMGKVIERMLAGDNIIGQFQEKFGYIIDSYSRNKTFGRGLEGLQGEIDLFLENGDIAILIEVKTTLETKDVRTHIERLEKFRRVADIKGDKRRFIGAVAGAVIEGDAEKVAHENGMYVIVQSGKAVEILPVPEGFVARQW